MNNGDIFMLQDDYIRNKYNTSRVEFIQGHIKTIGKTANKIKNPIRLLLRWVQGCKKFIPIHLNW